MKPIFVIADADGTLITGGAIHSVPFQLIERMALLRQEGTALALASGRPYEFLRQLHDYITGHNQKLAHEGVIYESGSYHQFGGRNVIVGGLTTKQLAEIDIFLAQQDLSGLVPLPETQFHTRRSWVTPQFAAGGLTDGQLLRHVYDALAPLVQVCFPYVQTTMSADAFDIEARGVGKGMALRPYLVDIAVDPRACVVIGDAANDFSMFDVIGNAGGLVVYVGKDIEQAKRVESYEHHFLPSQPGPGGVVEALERILKS